MANRIQLRHGSGIPTSNQLLSYELGWDDQNKKLYIGQDDDNPYLINGNVYTYIEKAKDTKNIISIIINNYNLISSKNNLKIYVYNCPRRRGKYYWRHPANYNYNNDNDNIETKMGYGILAEKPYLPKKYNNIFYPRIPDWMPNNGYLQTEFNVNNEKTDIDVTQWLLPLVRPRYRVGTEDWIYNGFIGVFKEKAPLIFKFALVKETNNAPIIIGESKNILAAGLIRGYDGNLLNIDETAILPQFLFISIR